MESWSATEVEGVGWSYTWVANPGDTYQIWHDGALIGAVTPETAVGDYSFGLDGHAASPPAVEIHNIADGRAQSEAFPTCAVLQWRGLTGASGYVVQRLDGNWSTVGTASERGLGWYGYSTPVLPDDLDVQFRVMALDAKGNAGAAVAFTVHLTRNPPPPSVGYVVRAGFLEIGAS